MCTDPTYSRGAPPEKKRVGLQSYDAVSFTFLNQTGSIAGQERPLRHSPAKFQTEFARYGMGLAALECD